MNDRELYDLMQNWAANRATDEQQLERLRQKILQAAAGGHDLPTAVRTDYARKRQHTAFRYGVVAAAAAISLTTAILWRPFADHPAPRQDFCELSASFSSDDLNDRATLFREVERLFNDDLRWLASSDAGLQMGIQSVSVEANSGTGSMAIRTVVLQKSNGDSSWRKVWKMDVMTRGEEWVELPANQNLPNRLALWAYTLPDGKIIVETQIALEGRVPLKAGTSKVLAPGKPVQVFSLKTKDGECRVLQAVAPLPAADKEAPCFAI